MHGPKTYSPLNIRIREENGKNYKKQNNRFGIKLQTATVIFQLHIQCTCKPNLVKYHNKDFNNFLRISVIYLVHI